MYRGGKENNTEQGLTKDGMREAFVLILVSSHSIRYHFVSRETGIRHDRKVTISARVISG